MTFIGPSAEAIAAMGDKLTALRLAKANDVPIIPGCEELKTATMRCARAAGSGFPSS